MKSCLTQIKRELNLKGFLPDISKLSELVEFCMQQSKTTPLILIFDECQELDYAAPKFWSELQNVWDKNKNESRLLLIMSGSIILPSNIFSLTLTNLFMAELTSFSKLNLSAATPFVSI